MPGRKVPFFNYPSVFLDHQDSLVAALVDVGTRGAFVMQSDLADFEGRLASYTGARYAVGVANATDGLHGGGASRGRRGRDLQSHHGGYGDSNSLCGPEARSHRPRSRPSARLQRDRGLHYRRHGRDMSDPAQRSNLRYGPAHAVGERPWIGSVGRCSPGTRVAVRRSMCRNLRVGRVHQLLSGEASRMSRRRWGCVDQRGCCVRKAPALTRSWPRTRWRCSPVGV